MDVQVTLFLVHSKTWVSSPGKGTTQFVEKVVGINHITANSHSNRCGMMSHYRLDLHSPVMSDGHFFHC